MSIPTTNPPLHYDVQRRLAYQAARRADARRYMAAQFLAAEVGRSGGGVVAISGAQVAAAVELADRLQLELDK